MSTPLPKYTECEYSLFVSYAHKDDESANFWISELRDAIWARLADLDKEIPRHQLHFSSDNGPGVGVLGHELQARVAKSFGMLLVVGKHYVESGWCQKELDYFGDVFGQDGFGTRLLIVAMSQEAIEKAKASAKARWPELVANEQIWLQMYQSTNPNEPIEPRTDNKKGFRREFFDHVKKLVDPLIEAIEADYRKTGSDLLLEQATDERNDAVTESEQTHGELKIAIAPTTSKELADKSKLLKEMLVKAGAECVDVTPDAFTMYDPDDPASAAALRAELRRADVLVVPYQEVSPLVPGVLAGGHIGILDREWQALKKERSVVWFKPDDLPVPESSVAAKHVQVFRSLGPLCESVEAVLSLILGQRRGSVITLCVEDDERNTLHEALVEKIRDLWEKVKQDRSLVPSLVCRPLDLDKFNRDAAGFVLLFPCGTKGERELRAEIQAIEEALEESAEYTGSGFANQGRVAVVLGEKSDVAEAKTVPRDLWQTFTCRQLGERQPPDLELLGEKKLEAFLNILAARHSRTHQSDGQR